MMSLFSPFDMLIFNMSFLVPFLCFYYILKSFFLSDSFEAKNYFLQSISSFFYSLKSNSFSKGFMLMSASLVLSISFLNVFSVFSYNFPLTSQFGMILGISFIYWLGLTMFSGLSNIKGFMVHLVPEGAPGYLSMVLFLIEIISSLIRPITLSVRLVANILAGHLLMVLLSKMVFLFYPSMLFYLVLNTVEMFVGLIQAYIMTTLVVLYFSEVH